MAVSKPMVQQSDSSSGCSKLKLSTVAAPNDGAEGTVHNETCITPTSNIKFINAYRSSLWLAQGWGICIPLSSTSHRLLHLLPSFCAKAVATIAITLVCAASSQQEAGPQDNTQSPHSGRRLHNAISPFIYKGFIPTA